MSIKRVFIITTVVIAIIITITALSSGALVKERLSDNLVTQYAQRELIVARQTSQLLEKEIASVQEKLNLVAQMAEIQSPDRESCSKKLTTAFEIMNSKLGNLGRVNEELKYYCALNSSLIGIQGDTLGIYVGELFRDPEHKPVFSRAFVLPSQKSYIAALHVPVFDGTGKFVGSLGGEVSFDEIQEKYLTGINIDKNGYVLLLDDNGDILYHPQKDLIGKNFYSTEIQNLHNKSTELNQAVKDAAEGKSGTTRYFGNNENRVAAYTSAQIFPNRRWIVMVTVPVESINQALIDVDLDRSFTLLTTVLTAVVALCFITFLFYLIKKIFNPLEKITQVAEQLGSGNLEVKVNFTGNDEIGKLARVFNDMVAKLKESYIILEEKVKERTRELEQAQKQLQTQNLTLETKVKERTEELEKAKAGLEVEVSNRTKELREKLDELERLNQLMVGREIKMAELKEELDRLKIKMH